MVRESDFCAILLAIVVEHDCIALNEFVSDGRESGARGEAFEFRVE